jgi:predicted nucleotidyltransferase
MLTPAALDKLVQDTVGRILSVVSAKQVFLFGSATRGDLQDNSDIDLLAVAPNRIDYEITH